MFKPLLLFLVHHPNFDAVISRTIIWLKILFLNILYHKSIILNTCGAIMCIEEIESAI
jgi:hypothetical protein